MRKMFATLFVAISMFFGSLNGVFGDNFKKAKEAIKRGDYQTAFTYLKPLAELGIADAQYNLGVMYARGEGVPQHYKMAVKWYTKAAKQGYTKAHLNLGIMYARGEGVPQDYKMAVKWLNKAAEQGDAKGQYNLGVMYGKGNGVPQDYKLAMKWYAKAAEQGDAKALYNLGIMHGKGNGVPQDYIKAHMWMNLSIVEFKNNELKAKAKIGRNFYDNKMTPEQIAKAQELATQCYAKKFKGC